MPSLDFMESFYMTHMTPGTKYLQDFNLFQDIKCEKCGAPVVNYDSGSMRYQEHYGHSLPAICDDCLHEFFTSVKRHGKEA